MATHSTRFFNLNYWEDKKTGFDYLVQMQVPAERMVKAEDLEILPLDTVNPLVNLEDPRRGPSAARGAPRRDRPRHVAAVRHHHRQRGRRGHGPPLKQVQQVIDEVQKDPINQGTVQAHGSGVGRLAEGEGAASRVSQDRPTERQRFVPGRVPAGSCQGSHSRGSKTVPKRILWTAPHLLGPAPRRTRRADGPGAADDRNVHGRWGSDCAWPWS